MAALPCLAFYPEGGMQFVKTSFFHARYFAGNVCCRFDTLSKKRAML